MLRHAHVPSPTLGAREVLGALARPATIEQAEHALARLTGGPTVLFASARGALAAAVELLAPGGRVAVPGYTCVAVANAVLSAGASAVWVDVGARGLVGEDAWPDADLCIVQDTYGFAAPIPAERAVVRDAAHRADALLDGPGKARVTVTSLEHSKWLSSGQGGVAVADDTELAEALRRVRDRHDDPRTGRLHALVTLLGLGAGRAARAGWRVPTELLTRAAIAVAPNRMAGQSAQEMRGGHIEPELLGPPSGAVARLVLSQMARAREVADHRREIVRRYDEAAGIAREPEPLLRYPLEAADPAAVTERVRAIGWELGRPWFVSPLHPCATPPPATGYAPGTAAEGERLSRHVVNLPTDPLLTRADADLIIGAALAGGARPLR